MTATEVLEKEQERKHKFIRIANLQLEEIILYLELVPEAVEYLRPQLTRLDLLLNGDNK